MVKPLKKCNTDDKQRVTKNMFSEACMQRCDYCVKFEPLWLKRIDFILKSDAFQGFKSIFRNQLFGFVCYISIMKYTFSIFKM